MAKKKQSFLYNKNHFEYLAWQQNQVVVGIDEVGRGCLAGPLVTAAVILPVGKLHRQLKDSKIMTMEERLIAYRWITKRCKFSIGIVHNRIIDEHNIWHSTLIAMKKALVHLLATSPQSPTAILVDAMPLNLFDTSYKDIPVHYFPFGERRSSSIAAASIVAKVTRDKLMGTYDQLFPGYALAKHKGYSTPEHKQRVRELGSAIIHRQQFLKHVFAQRQEEQMTLFSETIKEEQL